MALIFRHIRTFLPVITGFRQCIKFFPVTMVLDTVTNSSS